jgi:hypothetical protein
LRANGSRECAPDDRLREAIHPSVAAMDCFASLAMTVYFGFSKNEYERATLSAVIAREGACEGY